ncbi:MAG: hypothetical protein QNJ22_24275 [Desulfosarcinaceae bacterium]|nr:hypothetical protein [Desulfosarcinaceae bacterium]
MATPSQAAPSSAAKQVYIYSANARQNKLLAEFLHRESGLLCRHGEHFDDAVKFTDAVQEGQRILLLIDDPRRISNNHGSS